MAETLEKICDDVGVPNVVKEYLVVRKAFKSPEVTAKVGGSEEGFVAKVLPEITEG